MKIAYYKVTMGLMIFFSNTLHAICNEHISLYKPDFIYIEKLDGTVIDAETNLVWQKCSLGQEYRDGTCIGDAGVYTWADALGLVQVENNKKTFGFDDWRLPSVAELHTLVEKACFNPAININAFPATVSKWYWSSSPYTLYQNFVWAVNFGSSGDGALNKNYTIYVRLLRSR